MTVDVEVRSNELLRPTAASRGSRRPARTSVKRIRPIKPEIIDYLAMHGASRVSDISNAISCSRDCVRYHLAALETASLVRSDISPETRGRFTPFYALAPQRG
ncbi:ArsR family transcriptional regulator [Arthrobacter rhizosphaerae]|uniref:ArsR family transcriptional regulator n=1 Tax=Arthrobacter rhizosphaerae TaxID=2855490 RepID=UPI001FF43C81|nr:ArsR family transcriptional regulator [Arthrobacter rhizosphaerae]